MGLRVSNGTRSGAGYRRACEANSKGQLGISNAVFAYMRIDRQLCFALSPLRAIRAGPFQAAQAQRLCVVRRLLQRGRQEQLRAREFMVTTFCEILSGAKTHARVRVQATRRERVPSKLDRPQLEPAVHIVLCQAARAAFMPLGCTPRGLERASLQRRAAIKRPIALPCDPAVRAL